MNSELFTLTAEPEHPSLALPVPKGWTAHRYSNECGTFKKAEDPDGVFWYFNDGKWSLWITGFSATRPGLERDDIAVVLAVDGSRAYPITHGGTVKIGNRRITSRQWTH